MRKSLVSLMLILTLLLSSAVSFADAQYKEKGYDSGIESTVTGYVENSGPVRLTNMPTSNRSAQSLTLKNKPIFGNIIALYSEPIEKMPVGGGELPWNPTYWNSDDVRPYVNCYLYAINAVSSSQGGANPGQFAGQSMNFTESSIYSGMKADLKLLGKSIRRSSHSEVPGSDEYKIALVIDSTGSTPGVDIDYHFYRQDNDAGWSHKRGTTNINYRDADGAFIWCPKTCDRNYSSNLNYHYFANYYIVSN